MRRKFNRSSAEIENLPEPIPFILEGADETLNPVRAAIHLEINRHCPCLWPKNLYHSKKERVTTFLIYSTR